MRARVGVERLGTCVRVRVEGLCIMGAHYAHGCSRTRTHGCTRTRTHVPGCTHMLGLSALG